MKPTTQLTLSNFGDSHKFLKIANKLNHIVDTKRVYKLVNIDDDQMQFYSLTDAKQTVVTEPLSKVFVYNGSVIRSMTPVEKKYLKDVGVFYVINIENDRGTSMVISGKNFVAPDNEPKNVKAIADKYEKAFERIEGQYNYVSLENILPVQGHFDDAKPLDDVGYNLQINKYDTHGYNTVLCNTWGVAEDPGFNAHYDFAKRTISFSFNAMDGKNRDEAVMADYVKLFNGTDIQISALDDFIQESGLTETDYPRILDVMYELYEQTNIDFAVCIKTIGANSTWPLK